MKLKAIDATTGKHLSNIKQRRDNMSKLEAAMALQLRILSQDRPHLENYETEYRFAAMEVGGTGKGVRARLVKAGLKDWRFDFAWPEYLIAIEIEGGQWSNGRHQRGKGFEDDCEKYNAAAFYRWSVFRFTTNMVNDGRSMRFLESVFPVPMILAI
jgi:hypothetical protein